MDETTQKVMAVLLTQQNLQMLAWMAVTSSPNQTRPIERQYQEMLALAQERLGARTVAQLRQQISILVQAVSAKTVEDFQDVWRKMDVLNQFLRQGLDELLRDPPPTD